MRLVVLEGVAESVVELSPAHIGVEIDENPLPRHFDVVEIDERIVLVETPGNRVVKERDGGSLVRFARQQFEPFCSDRNCEREREVFLARLQGLEIGDQDLIRHDRAGAEHLGAAHRDPARILVDELRDQLVILLAPRL